MDKTLFFRNSSTGSYAIPEGRVIRMVGGGGFVTFLLDSASRIGNPQSVLISCTVGKEDKVIEDINNAVKNSRDQVIVIADDVIESYLSQEISGLVTGSGTLYVNS